MLLSIIILKLLAVLTITSAQFLEQPDPGTKFALNQVTLTCSVEEGYIIDWLISWSNGEEVDASSDLGHQVLMERNFTLEGVVTSRSTLSLQESIINNATNITCVAQEEGSRRSPIAGNTVQVIFYAGVPLLSINPIVTENELGFLNISWSLEFIEGVPVNYTLTVLNLNTTSVQPIIIAGLQDQHYVFETRRPCDVYSFTVTAVTAAGSSTPSQEIIFMCSRNDSIEMDSTLDQSTVKVTKLLATTEGFDVAVYIGSATAASVALIAVMIIILTLYYYNNQKRKKTRNCDVEAEMNASHNIQSNAIQTQMIDDARDGTEMYAQVDSGNTEEKALPRGELAQTDQWDQPTPLYAELDKSKKLSLNHDPNTETEVLYAQVDKHKESINEKASSQPIMALYAEVDKKKASDDPQTEMRLLSAQVCECKDRNKNNEKASATSVKSQPMALYAEVDKSKKRKKLPPKDDLKSEGGPLYTQVYKRKVEKLSKANNIEEDAKVDNVKSNDPRMTEVLYACVNKIQQDWTKVSSTTESDIHQNDLPIVAGDKHNQ